MFAVMVMILISVGFIVGILKVLEDVIPIFSYLSGFRITLFVIYAMMCAVVFYYNIWNIGCKTRKTRV